MPDADPAIIRDPERLAILDGLGLMDGDTAPAFDRLTRLASQILNVPVALITLIDSERQFFLSQLGVDEPYASQRGTPLSHSYCQHAVASQQPLVIPDAAIHPLVHDNPALTELDAAAYAGIPLCISGHVVGTLCVVHHQPHQWTEQEISILTDLTEFVLTEIELRQELAARQRLEAKICKDEQFIRQVINAIPMMIFLYDLDRDEISYTNTPEGHFLGFHEALTLDKVLSASDLREVLAIAASLFADVTPAGQIVDVEMKARHADKRQGYIRLRLKAFVAEGETRRVLGIAEDVTDYREVERSALESKLRAARLQMLHTFIEHASHDLRTPLTIIQTNAYLLSKGVQADDKLRDRVDKISEQVHKITDTIGDFLTLVRLDQTPGLEVTAISVNGLLLRTIHLLRSQMKAVPKIVEHLAADLPTVRGDSTLLQQVFYAVLENAVHYTPLDGEIQVRTAEDSGTVMVEIADTGPGIDPADRPLIFQPMFKGNRFRSNDAGRSGMGLAIAHRIMTLHNGSIEADAEVSQGTLIRIRLPF